MRAGALNQTSQSIRKLQQPNRVVKSIFAKSPSSPHQLTNTNVTACGRRRPELQRVSNDRAEGLEAALLPPSPSAPSSRIKRLIFLFVNTIILRDWRRIQYFLSVAFDD